MSKVFICAAIPDELATREEGAVAVATAIEAGDELNRPRYPAHAGEPRHAESPAYSQSLEQWNKLSPIVSHIRSDFPEPYGLPVDGLRGKNEYF